MLQGFRKIINSFVGKVFFTLLLATFALLGVGYGFRDLVLGATGASDAASVGGRKISLVELDRKYREQLSNYQKKLDPNSTVTQQQKQELARATLDREITEALYAEAAAQSGLRVSDDLVRQVIQSEPAFAGDDKRFDPSHFRAMLENQGLSEAMVVPQIRSDIARQLLVNPIAGSAFAPKMLAEEMYRYRNEQRVAQTVFIPNSSAANIAAPSEADINAYYQKHAVDFTAPEYRTFTVLSLTPELFVKDAKPVSDEDVRAAYESRKSEYGVPEKRKIEQVVLNDKETAEAVSKAAKGGKSLADAAKAVTGGKAQPVTLDPLTRDQYPEGLRDAVFAAAKDAVTGPIQTPLGWHVLEVRDIQTGHEVPFEEVRVQLADELKRDAAIDVLSEKIDKLGDRLLGGAPMEEVAASVNAMPVKIGPLDARGNPPASAKANPPPAQDPALLTTAFQLQSGETSSIQNGKDGAYFAIRLDSITPPALRPLADVRADIVAGWTAEQRAAQIAKRAADLMAKAAAGTPLGQIANEAGAKLETTPPVTRDPVAAKTSNPPPIAVVDAMFQLAKIGDVTSVATSEGEVIVRLTEIRPADPLAIDAPLQPISQELTAGLQGDFVAEYLAGLRQEYKVKINPGALETVAGQ